jgi:hypothetical protein
MNNDLDEFAVASELIVIGRVGMMTNTGASINAMIDVQQAIKGNFSGTDLRLVLPTMGSAHQFLPERDKQYIFGLTRMRGTDVLAYNLAPGVQAAIEYEPAIAERLRAIVNSAARADAGD